MPDGRSPKGHPYPALKGGLMSLEVLDRAAAAATCQTLSAAGSSLVGAGAVSIAFGGTGVVPVTVGMLSLLASNALCPGNIPVDENTSYKEYVGGCSRVTGSGQLQLKTDQATEWSPWPGAGFPTDEAVEIADISRTGDAPNIVITVKWKILDGSIAQHSIGPSNFDLVNPRWRIEPWPGSSCDSTPDEPTPLPPDIYDPIPYTDPDTGCQLNVTFQGFAQAFEGGPIGTVYQIESAPSLRASGGVVGGCNFAPTIVYTPPGGGGGGGGGGGPVYVPVPDTGPPAPGPGGVPWWVTPIASAVTSALVDELFKTKYPAGSKTIYAACEYKEDGSKEEFTVNFPEETYQERVLTALNAITDFQQQILYWKTPICSGSPIPLTGDPVSINWVSDEYSPNGNNRIRKLLTYFDQKNTSLADTVAHWKDFTWDAGPVIVSCVGTPLGKPQVWAASVDEAKRVINHAAVIAGVDTTNAEWLVAAPKSARFGMQGKMRVHRGANGALGITKRDGPNGLPPALT